MTNALHDQLVEILSTCFDMAISTVRSDGFPQTTHVSYVNDGDRVYFVCWAQSQKARNIAQCDKVSFAVFNGARDWKKIRGVDVGGRAAKVDQPQELVRFKQLMMRKFPSIAKFLNAPEVDFVVFRVDPVAACVLDYSKNFGNSEAVSFTSAA